LNFNYTPGSGTPPSQSVGILSTPGATNVSVTTTTSDGGAWLQAATVLSAGMTPGTVIVSLNSPALSANTNYNGQINITAPNATPASITVPVTVQVAAVQGPQLTVTPSLPGPAQSFGLPQGAQSSGSVAVTNTGGGTLNYTAGANSDSGWLSLSGGSTGSVTPGAPGSIQFAVNATGISVGFHQGTIAVTDGSGNTQTSGVDLLVNGTAASMQLSQTGLTFYAVVGSSISVPAQYVSVYNLGSSNYTWSAQVAQYLPASSSGWLVLSPSTGSSTSGAPGEFKVSVSPGGLLEGQYYATVSVGSTGAVNAPQSFTVLLNVVNAGDLGSTPEVTPSGGILSVTAGGSVPATQSVNLLSLGGQAVSYSTAVSLGSGSTQWLTVTPANGTLGASGVATLTLSASGAGLTAGVYNGTVEVAFSQGTVETITVALVVVPGSGSTGGERSNATTGCKPTKLVPVLSAPAGGTQFVAGQPGNVAVQISDDCYNLATQKSSPGLNLQLYQNGVAVKPPLSFTYDNDNAVWTATWVPGSATSSKLVAYASVAAAGGVGSYSGESAPVSVNVLPSDPASASPQPTGPLNAASFATALQGTVVPLEYVSIFGQSLADKTAGSGVPLGSALAGAQLAWNGNAVPLLNVSGGQVNAVVPQALQPNTTAALTLQRDNTVAPALSTPVAEFQPGIFTMSQTGVGQGAILNYEAGVVAGAGPGQQAVSPGGIIEIYLTGLGAVKAMDGSNTAPAGDGVPAPSSPLFVTTGTVSVTIGGVSATPVYFAGLSPGYIALYQINVQVPANAPVGTGVPVIVTITDAAGNSASSQAGVTIAVQ
jgi:uncharacterized protein (TIGR03437 family)